VALFAAHTLSELFALRGEECVEQVLGFREYFRLSSPIVFDLLDER
jgi:hypothetical protein